MTWKWTDFLEKKRKKTGREDSLKDYRDGASLVAQWLRILPMQGTQV